MKKIISAILTGILASSAFAFDFGANISVADEYSGKEIKEGNNELDVNAAAWIRFSLGNKGRNYLATQASVSYEMDTAWKQSPEHDFYVDLDLFKFNLNATSGSNSFDFALGRVPIQDTTYLILNQISDGAFMNFENNYINFSLFSGWTGLLNARSTSILDSHESTFTYDENAVYALASPYWISSFNWTSPFLFFNQTLNLQAVTAIGTKGITADNTGYNRYFATVGLNGPLSSSLFYDITTTVETEDFKNYANLTKIGLNFFPNMFMHPILSASLLYASGDNFGLVPFKSFTSASCSMQASSPEYTGRILAGISGSIKPFSIFLVQASCDAVLNVETEYPSYEGFQWQAALSVQPFTDLSISLGAGQFIASEKLPDENNTSITLNASFAF